MAAAAVSPAPVVPAAADAPMPDVSTENPQLAAASGLPAPPDSRAATAPPAAAALAAGTPPPVTTAPPPPPPPPSKKPLQPLHAPAPSKLPAGDDDDDDDDENFLSGLKAEDGVKILAFAPTTGNFVADHLPLLYAAVDHFKGWTNANECSEISALRTQCVVGGRSCYAITVTIVVDDSVDFEGYISEFGNAPVILDGSPFYLYGSLDEWQAAIGARISRDGLPHFTLLLSQLPCIRASSIQGYTRYFETVAYKHLGAQVDAVTVLNKKQMGATTNEKSGSLIFRVIATESADLATFRIKRPVPALALGASAKYKLTVQSGNYKCIGINGVDVTTEKCCGVIKGNPHADPTQCAVIRADMQKKTERFEAFMPDRALKLRVAARPELFVGIAMEFRVFATRAGYVPCDCFLNTGKCRFINRPGKPCVNFPCGYKHMDFVATRLAKLE